MKINYIPSHNPDLPQLVVVAWVQDKETGRDDGKHMETHLDEIASVIEERHSSEHYQKLQYHAYQEYYCHASQTKIH